MSDESLGTPGQIVWQDLTVPDAAAVRDFYAAVVGWSAKPHPMGDYDDYEMQAPGSDQTIAGICYAKGPNANVPPQWLLYTRVEDVDASAARCVELGGTVLDGPRAMGAQRFAVIQDPAGAVMALIG